MSQLELQLIKKQIQDAFLQRFSPVLLDLYANPANRPSNAHQLNAFLYFYLRTRACADTKECLTEDALEDITRAAEIVEVTGQREILSTWIEQSNEFLKDRIVRPDSSIGADEQKILVITDETEGNKNVT